MKPVVVDEALTRRVAELARLDLTDAEVSLFTQQMTSVLAHIDQLTEVDVTGYEPMVHPFDADTPFREDVAIPFPTDAEGNPKVMSAAPDVLYDGYKVPQIL